MIIKWKSKIKNNISLSRFLYIHKVSHKSIKKLKKEGEILINNKIANLLNIVSYGDIVTVKLPNENYSNLIFDHHSLNVIYEDNNWLLVNKPYGISSVPGPNDREGTLVNRINYYMFSHNKKFKAHLITRLDYDTSGIVLVAKNSFVHGLIQSDIENHNIDKEYLALISGNMNKNEGIINLPIGKSKDIYDPRRIVTDQGKSAITIYHVLKTFNNVSLVHIRLVTGRTHQIRVHFSYLGHPLIGDKLYGGSSCYGIHRQALHAWKLTFFDPVDEVKRNFTSKLPDDFCLLIDRLKNGKY